MLGRTTGEIELRYSQNEKHTAVAAFSLAVDDGYGDNKRTNFFEFVAFGKGAENIQKYCPKGTKIAVVAHAQQSTWNDRETGKNRSRVVFVLETWEYAQSKSEAKQSSNDWQNIADDMLDDLPFN